MTTGVGRVGFVKLGGQHHLAVGYWGRYSGFGVYSRVICDQSIFKMLKLNVDKVLGMGLRADLWREVYPVGISEATPISGLAIGFVSPTTPLGTGTLTLTLAAPRKNLTWTAPGLSVSATVDIAAGGSFVLASGPTGQSYLIVNADASELPSSGGPFSNVVTVQRSLQRSPTFDPQVDQTSLTNDVYPLCSCYKETSKQPDNKCLQCYGTGVIPGYTKFGHTEMFIAATAPSAVLVNTELMQDNTPFRIQLATGQTTGTFTSPDFSVNNPSARPFVVQTVGQLWQAGNTITTAFSVNGGGVYADISTINTTIPTTGVIRFRVTLTRPSTTVKSPRFEILRARHARMDEPFVRMLKGLPTRTRARDAYGIVDSDGNFRYWTVPLRHFDDLIAQDPDAVTPPEENKIQQKAFLEFREGVHTGERYDMTNFEHHDPGGIFISQGFTARRMQRDEIQSKVF